MLQAGASRTITPCCPANDSVFDETGSWRSEAHATHVLAILKPDLTCRKSLSPCDKDPEVPFVVLFFWNQVPTKPY